MDDGHISHIFSRKARARSRDFYFSLKQLSCLPPSPNLALQTCVGRYL